MREDITYAIKRMAFDEDYLPSDNTRATTNFANLARGAKRQDNLRNLFRMIDNRLNALAHWDNPSGDRYRLELEIITGEFRIGETSEPIPLIEILSPSLQDLKTGQKVTGIAGNNFSSYIRDYDFSILLPRHNEGRTLPSAPENFGDLHGKIYKSFVNSAAYRAEFHKPPLICLSASTSRIYHRSANTHPVLGVEYLQDAASATDLYFEKMGLQVRHFMPALSMAPLAFYFTGDLLNDYTNLELIGTISTMETFQRIYRPEIYNAHSPAGARYQPSLTQKDFSLTQIVYDRDERSRLAREQGRFAEETFIEPYRETLAKWSAQQAARSL